MREKNNIGEAKRYIYNTIRRYEADKKIVDSIDILYDFIVKHNENEVFKALSIEDKEKLVKEELCNENQYGDIINISKIIKNNSDSILLVDEANASNLLAIKEKMEAQTYGIATNDKLGSDIISNLMNDQHVNLINDFGSPLTDIRTRQLFDLVIVNVLSSRTITDKIIDSFKNFIGYNYDLSQLKNYRRREIINYLYAIRALECTKDEHSYVVVNCHEGIDLSFLMNIGCLEAVISIDPERGCYQQEVLVLSKQKHTTVDFYILEDMQDFADLWHKKLEKQNHVMMSNKSAKVNVSYEYVLSMNNYQSRYYVNDVRGKLKNTVLLKDIADIKRGYMNGDYGVDSKNEIIDGEAVLLKVSDLKDGNIYNDELIMNIPSLNNIHKGDTEPLQAGDILISVRGYAREIALITKENEKLPLFCGFHLARIRITDDRFTPEYLMAYLRSENGQKLFKQQSGSQILVSINELKQMPIEVPNKEVCKQITDKLSYYNQKLRDSHQSVKEYYRLINECYDDNSNNK